MAGKILVAILVLHTQDFLTPDQQWLTVIPLYLLACQIVYLAMFKARQLSPG